MAHPQSTPRGLRAMKALYLGTHLVNSNSTAILIPAAGFQFAALTSLKITSDSTGILIGSRYISTNTTGNSTT